MTSRERFVAGINHKEPDKIPVDFGAHNCSGIHVSCVEALRDYYGLEKHPVKMACPFEMIGVVEDDLKEAMGIDICGVDPETVFFGIKSGFTGGWKEWRSPDGQVLMVPNDFNPQSDGKGGLYMYPEGDTSCEPSGHMPAGGVYFDAIIRQQPFDDDELDYRDNLEEYGPISEESLQHLKTASEKAAKSNRGVVASLGGMALGDIAFIPGTGLKNPKGIRSIEEWYMSPLIRPDYVKNIYVAQVELALENLEKIYNMVGDNLDAVFICGTDFGTQNSTFLSVDTYKEFYMPYYQKMNNWIHEHTNWKTIKHSCGAVYSLIPSFIESGFDCLNPVQCSATGMDPKKLKKEFGNDIVFWGGGVDTQKTLPFGTPEEVRREVLERCEIFAPGGGFVFNAVHCIQRGTPIENLVAMIDAVKEFNK